MQKRMLNDGTPPHETERVIEDYARPWWFRRIRDFSVRFAHSDPNGCV